MAVNWTLVKNPNDWYWSVTGVPDQVYSSSAGVFVATSDATYNSWLSAGNVPTVIESITNLGIAILHIGAPSPIDTDVALAYRSAQIDRISLAVFSVLHDHENRIRALQLEAAQDYTQFRQYISDLIVE